MKLVIESRVLKIADDLASALSEWVLRAVEEMRVDSGCLDVVHLADEESYAGAIQAIDPSATFSKGQYVGMGKTLRSFGSDGSVHCSIVVRLELFLHELWRENTFETFTREAPPISADYVLRHELAHCLDYTKRKFVDSEEPIGPFSLPNLERYYSAIVETEFAASALSAAAMPAAEYSGMAAQFADMVKMRTELMTRRLLFRTHIIKELRPLAVDAASFYWVVLIQFAKLAGTRIGNRTLPPPELAFAVGPLQEFESALRDCWEKYPRWCDGTGPRGLARRAWDVLTNSEGFYFAEKEGHPALFFSPEALREFALG